MAFSTNTTITKDNLVGTVTDRAGKTPQTRGLIYNGQPCELKQVQKLTGDTSGSVDVSSVFADGVREVRLMATRDSAGANSSDTDDAWKDIAFTVTDFNTLALTGLGDWTAGILFIFGRAK